MSILEKSMKRADETELQILYRNNIYSIGHLAQNSLSQVLFAFKIYDWHLTLHKKEDGSILRTLYDPTKRRGSIDHQYVETAKALGYKNPDKHGNYIAHSTLIRFSNYKGYHLVNIRLDLLLLPKENKLSFRKKVYLKTSKPNIDLKFILITENETFNPDSVIIPTKLGDVAVSLKEK